jgi:mannose-1-phosphate guanylyltransferase
MAGGVGSRFWPASTDERPKQFLDMLGLGRTLFQQTVDRFTRICPVENMLTVTSEMYAALVREQCPDMPADNILTEPCMRNTAPCIAYAAWKIRQKNPDALVVVTPADHLISDPDVFRQTVAEGLEFVRQKPAILTLGIHPRSPETGYGYIQTTDKADKIAKVKSFREKPDRATAEAYLASGDYFWNAGIFLWKNSVIIDAFRQYKPAIAALFAQGEAVYYTDNEQSFINAVYPQCENISIDYAIMERADNLYVGKAEFNWSDLGTWSALWGKSEKTGEGNACSSPQAQFYEASDNIVHVPHGKRVVIQGLDNFIVVDTGDVLMICSMKEEQRIKDFRNDSIN